MLGRFRCAGVAPNALPSPPVGEGRSLRASASSEPGEGTSRCRPLTRFGGLRRLATVQAGGLDRFIALEFGDPNGVFRLQTVIRLCRPSQRTVLLARQQCSRRFFGNYPVRVDSRFCKAHPYTDKSRRCDSHSTLEGRTELGRRFEWRTRRSASNTS